MANLFSVGDPVICQKTGGQSGNKKCSPAVPGKVLEVLSGGTEYRVHLKWGDATRRHFPNNIVKEQYMTGA